MDESPAIKRLGIPQFQWWNEALHGVGRNGTSTVFPITMGMAASWDDALLFKVYDAVSDEARAKAQQSKGHGRINRYQSLSFWTPNINIFRDPRFKGGDRTDIELPQVLRDLMASIHKSGKKLVFVNCSGGAMGLEPESQNCDAILQAWYLGEKGGEAVADVIFGDVNPSGKTSCYFL